VRGKLNCRDGWDHPPGSNLIGWTKRAAASTLVYLQPGDGASAFANVHYRRLLENAIRWVVAKDPRPRSMRPRYEFS
jgi:type 1 glutamine amidotransferase